MGYISADSRGLAEVTVLSFSCQLPVMIASRRYTRWRVVGAVSLVARSVTIASVGIAYQSTYSHGRVSSLSTSFTSALVRDAPNMPALCNHIYDTMGCRGECLAIITLVSTHVKRIPERYAP